MQHCLAPHTHQHMGSTLQAPAHHHLCLSRPLPNTQPPPCPCSRWMQPWHVSGSTWHHASVPKGGNIAILHALCPPAHTHSLPCSPACLPSRTPLIWHPFPQPTPTSQPASWVLHLQWPPFLCKAPHSPLSLPTAPGEPLHPHRQQANPAWCRGGGHPTGPPKQSSWWKGFTMEFGLTLV